MLSPRLSTVQTLVETRLERAGHAWIERSHHAIRPPDDLYPLFSSVNLYFTLDSLPGNCLSERQRTDRHSHLDRERDPSRNCSRSRSLNLSSSSNNP